MKKFETQPNKYSKSEVKRLQNFIDMIKNDASRSSLACWGNHSEYSKGY